MKSKFQTLKIATIRDYFNIGLIKDNEADYSLHIILFGREFSWYFYKKDSVWIDYYEDEV
jgi:hypothetical protein